MSSLLELRQSVRTSFLPYTAPSIGEEEIAEVVDTLRSGCITTGPKVKRFEDEFSAYVGSDNAVAVNSCTAGLHAALAALGIGPGDEVILPTFTFCATANVVVHLGARPILVDTGADLEIEPAAVEAAVSTRTRAIMPVHYAGQACDLDALYAIAARHDVAVVEDAAHAIGTSYNGKSIGSDYLSARYPQLRRATAFSFNADKNLTTGEGGMITTADNEFAQQMRVLSSNGMSNGTGQRYPNPGSWSYEVVTAGYKSNMTDVAAALGIHQLRRLNGFIDMRQKYARMYDEAFAELDVIETPIKNRNRNHVYHLYAIRLNLAQLTIDRAQFIEELKNLGIGAEVHFIPVHLHPFYREYFDYQPGDLPRAEAIYNSILSLPLYPLMSEADVNDVITAVHHLASVYRR